MNLHASNLEGATLTLDSAYQLVPTDALVPSSSNPRRTFDEGKLAELARSMRHHGVLSPLLVRPMPGVAEDAAYEVVAGERRLRAARRAKVEEVPVLIRELDDREVLELQVIENNQRENVSPVEEAEAFAQLVDAGMAVHELANRIGRSTAFVERRLRLMRLPELGRSLVHDGRLFLGHALKLAGLPDVVLVDVLGELEREFDRGGDGNRRVDELIRTRMRMLDGRQFDPNDSDLSDVGSCLGCPHNTGSQGDLFEVSHRNRCLNGACYNEKVAAQAERVRAELVARGARLLDSPPEMEQLARPVEDVRPFETYRDGLLREAAATQTWELEDEQRQSLTAKRRELALVTRPDDFDIQPVWYLDRAGTYVQAFLRDEFVAAAEEADVDPVVVEAARGGHATVRDTPLPGAAGKPRLPASRRWREYEAVCAALEHGPRNPDAIRSIAMLAVQTCRQRALQVVAERRGWAEDAETHNERIVGAIEALNGLGRTALSNIVLELAFAEFATQAQQPEPALESWLVLLETLNVPEGGGDQ